MGDTLEALRDFGIAAELWAVWGTLERLREEVWLAASEIVASTDSVREEVERLRGSVDQQTGVLRRGFDRIDARLDLQTHIMRKTLEALYRPSEVRARELRDRGERALRAGLYDDALKDLLDSLNENRYDFTSHFAAATIYLERLDDVESAWNHCELALGYARMWPGASDDPTPAYYSSRCILLMGRMMEEGGLVDEALRYYEAACLASPDYGECFRRYARAAARMGKIDLAMAAIRAAVLVDEGEAVLIEQDEDLRGITDRIGEFLAALRQETHSAAARLAPLAQKAVRAYHWVNRTLQSGPVTQALTVLENGPREELGDLAAREGRLRQTLTRALDLHRRASLLDLAQACRDFWTISDEVRCVSVDVQGYADWAIPRIRQKSESELASATKWADMEYLTAQEEARDPELGGWGCLFVLWGLFAVPVGGMAFAGGIVGLLDPETQGIGAFCLFFGGIVLLSWLGPMIWWQSTKNQRKRARQWHAQDVATAARRTHARRSAAIRKAESALANLVDLHIPLYRAGEILSSSDIACSLILLDPGAKRDGYDETKLAITLQGLAQDWSKRDALSVEEVKEIIRDAPAVFLRDLSVPDAEAIAAFLRRELGVSVGIKRRYVGQFPSAQLAPV